MNKTQIKQIIDRGRVWDLANKHLYDLFKKNFEHDSPEKIIAKTWILGRTYIVALERGKNKKNKNQKSDDFYTDVVFKTFKDENSEIDNKLNSLKKHKKIEMNILKEIFETHKYLSDLVNKISRQNRSFASKYLHFHLPHLYFIYDSRASQKIRKIVKNNKDFKKFKEEIEQKTNIKNKDKEYYNFYLKCLYFLEKTKTNLTTRELDDYLLYAHDDEISNKSE